MCTRHPPPIPSDHRPDEALLDPLETPSTCEQRLPFEPSHVLGDGISPEPPLSCVFRHSGWARDRKRVYESLKRTRQTVSRIVEFATCGEGIHVYQSMDDPEQYKLAGSTCKDRFCLPCARNRAGLIRANLLEYVANRRVRMVTLTLAANRSSLSARLDELYTAFRALQRNRTWRRTVHGGAYFLEVTYNAQLGSWHTHFHLLTTGKYIDHAWLSHTWHNITEQSFIVHVTLARSPRDVADYATKYVSKPFDATFTRDPNLLDEAVLAFKGRRLCGCFGTWREFRLTATSETDAWVDVGTLDDYLRRALEHDRRAIAVLAKFDQPSVAAALAYLHDRAPPPWQKPPNANLTPYFPGFWDTMV